MPQSDPERTGPGAEEEEEGVGRPPNDERPDQSEASVSTNHQEQVQAVAALFGPSRPKDIVTGTANGIAMGVAGVCAGVGALTTFPVIGAIQGGPMGACAGVGVGAVAFIGLPVYGVVAGAGQVVSGLFNTPYSMSESLAWGKQWDEVKISLGSLCAMSCFDYSISCVLSCVRKQPHELVRLRCFRARGRMRESGLRQKHILCQRKLRRC